MDLIALQSEVDKEKREKAALERTKGRLARKVDDLTSQLDEESTRRQTLERKCRQLERDSRSAQTDLEEANAALARKASLERQLRELKGELEDALRRAAEADKRAGEMERKEERTQAALRELEQQVEEYSAENENLRTTAAQASRLERERDRLLREVEEATSSTRQRLQRLQGDNTTLRRDLTDAEYKAAEAEKLVDRQRSDLEALRRQYEEARDSLKQATTAKKALERETLTLQTTETFLKDRATKLAAMNERLQRQYDEELNSSATLHRELLQAKEELRNSSRSSGALEGQMEALTRARDDLAVRLAAAEVAGAESQAQVALLADRLQDALQSLKRLQEEKDDAQHRARALEEVADELEGKLAAGEKDYNELEGERDKLESDMLQLQEKYASATQYTKQLESTKAKVEKEVASLGDQLGEALSAYEGLEKEHTALAEQLETLRARESALQADVQAQREKAEAASAAAAQAAKELEAAGERVRVLAAENKTLAKGDQVQELQKLKANVEAALDEAKAQVANLTATNASLDAELAALKPRYDSLEAQLQVAVGERDALRTEKERLADQIEGLNYLLKQQQGGGGAKDESLKEELDQVSAELDKMIAKYQGEAARCQETMAARDELAERVAMLQAAGERESEARRAAEERVTALTASLDTALAGCKDLEDTRRQLQAATSEAATARADADALRVELAGARDMASGAGETSATVAVLEEQKLKLREEVLALQAAVAKESEANTQLAADMAALRVDVATAKDELATERAAAEKLEKKLAAAEQARAAEVAAARAEAETHEKEARRQQQQRQQVEDELSAATARLKELEAKAGGHGKLEDELAEARADLQTRTAKLNALAEEVKAARKAAADAEARVAERERERDDAARERQAVLDKLKVAEAEAQERADEADRARRRVQVQADEAREELARATSALEDEQRRTKKALGEAEEARAERAEVKAALDAALARLDTAEYAAKSGLGAETELSKVTLERSELRRQLDDATSALSDLRTKKDREVRSLEEELQAAKQKHQESSSEATSLRRQLEEARESADKERARAEAAADAQRSLQGAAEGTRKEVARLEARLADATKAAEAAERDTRKLAAEAEALRTQAASVPALQSARADLERALAEAKAEKEDALSQLQAMERASRQDTSDLRTQLSESRDKIYQLEQALRAEQDKAAQALEGSVPRAKVDEIKDTVSALEKELLQTRLHLDEAKKGAADVEEKTARIRTLERELSDAQYKQEDLASSKKKLEAELTELKATLAAVPVAAAAAAVPAHFSKDTIVRTPASVSRDTVSRITPVTSKTAAIPVPVTVAAPATSAVSASIDTERVAPKLAQKSLETLLAAHSAAKESPERAPADSTALTHITKGRLTAMPKGRKQASRNPVRNRPGLAEKIEEPKEQKKSMGFKGSKATGAQGLARLGMEAIKARANLMSKSPSTMNLMSQLRLLKIKGRKAICTVQVELAASSLNHGDVFVLETPTRVFQWTGKDANRLEKAKGVDIHQKANRSRGGRNPVIVLEDGVDDDNAEFWELLRGSRADVRSTEEGGDDEAFEREQAAQNKLFIVPEEGGFSAVHAPKLTREILDTNECYILDCYSELYVWSGRGASSDRKNAAYQTARDLWDATGRPAWGSNVVKVTENGEPFLFQEKFASWPDSFAQHAMGKVPARASKEASPSPLRTAAQQAAAMNMLKADATRMHSQPVKAPAKPVDDGSGTVKVFLVENFKRVALPPSEHGQFHSGHCYIVEYLYHAGSSRVVYFWQGCSAARTDKGASATMFMEMTDGPPATQVRVEQQKEPLHFYLIFQKCLAIHYGKKSDNRATRLYDVYSPLPDCTLAVECPDASLWRLNTNFCSVLQTSSQQYLWFGAHAPSGLHTSALTVSSVLKGSRTVTHANEGSEPPALFTAFSGRVEHMKVSLPCPPRLFSCDSASGVFRADPVAQFNQDDLRKDAVAILDLRDNVYVWTGSRAKEADKKLAFETALDYVRVATDGRAKNTPVLQVREGVEDLLFRSAFHAWDKGANAAESQERTKQVKDMLAEYRQTFSIEQLRNRDSLPPTVNRANLEEYLHDNEYEAVFGLAKDAFLALPQWKKSAKKKQAGLF